MKIKLLIVEDDLEIIKNWKQSIAMYNVDEDERKFYIDAEYVDNLSKSQEFIGSQKIDGIIIDIRLKNDDQQPNMDGNHLINDAISQTMALIAVCTAEPATVEIPTEQTELIKVFQKGVAGTDVVAQCIEWLESKVNLITSVQRMRSDFDKEMATLFSKSIWARWNYWIEHTDPQETNRALTRHMATHLHASFLNQVEAVHPEEYYFIPPLREKLDTGDIILHEDAYHILVTPRCDLARENNVTFQLVKLNSKKEDWETLHTEKAEGINKKARDSASRKIRNIVNHGDRSPKLHFIPQFKLSTGEELGPFHAQFNMTQCLEATPESRAQLTEERVATLSNEFVPSLVERLGAFFSRIGTPDYSHPE